MPKGNKNSLLKMKKLFRKIYILFDISQIGSGAKSCWPVEDGVGGGVEVEA